MLVSLGRYTTKIERCQGGVSYKPTEAPACAKAEPALRQRLEANALLLPGRGGCPEKPTRVAAPSPRANLGRRTVCGRTEQRRPPVSKRYETKVRICMSSFLIAAAVLKTPTRNGYNARGVNLTFYSVFIYGSSESTVLRSVVSRSVYSAVTRQK